LLGRSWAGWAGHGPGQGPCEDDRDEQPETDTDRCLAIERVEPDEAADLDDPADRSPPDKADSKLAS
jgi:hypothetical protein